ncbi:MAG: sigma-54-dependent Fis family transcriptional regulator [Myxococcales bacterium]|nr:sigma-54-dependent Fis family transcriptional regulator [Myxococcales bacterium]
MQRKEADMKSSSDDSSVPFVPIGVSASSAAPTSFFGVVTRDPGLLRVFRIVEKAAQSQASVLLRGETGTGKELLASALHQLSPRQSGPFHAISCAALPASLLESELFGHVRGSFTGAVRDNPGHFRLANKGTLFLDEVAEMPLEVQAKLLRVLETHSVIPVGGREPISVDVRIIAATHKALRGEVEAGRFRADLMYRLRVVPIFIPPLRERIGDVLLLAEHFILELNQRSARRIDRISSAAAQILEAYDWPGNIRELRNVIEYAFVIGEGPVLDVADLPPELGGTLQATTQRGVAPLRSERALDVQRVSKEQAKELEETLRIEQALVACHGQIGEAAKILSMSRVTLWRKMKTLGLSARAVRSARSPHDS